MDAWGKPLQYQWWLYILRYMYRTTCKDSLPECTQMQAWILGGDYLSIYLYIARRGRIMHDSLTIRELFYTVEGTKELVLSGFVIVEAIS